MILSIELVVQTGKGKQKKTKTTLYSSSAIAVSNTRALASLHGKIPLNTPVKLTTRRGIPLTGKEEFEKYEQSMVDIAVILLDLTSNFDCTIPWTDQPVRLTQPICVVGLKYGSVSDSINAYARNTSVDMIEDFGESSALFKLHTTTLTVVWGREW